MWNGRWKNISLNEQASSCIAFCHIRSDNMTILALTNKRARKIEKRTKQLKEKSPTVKCPEFNQCPLHLNGHSRIIIQDLDLCVRDHCGSLRTPNSTLPTQWSAPLAYLLSCLCFIVRLLLTETPIFILSFLLHSYFLKSRVSHMGQFLQGGKNGRLMSFFF